MGPQWLYIPNKVKGNYVTNRNLVHDMFLWDYYEAATHTNFGAVQWTSSVIVLSVTKTHTKLFLLLANEIKSKQNENVFKAIN